MKEETKKNLWKLRQILFEILWWAVIIIYVYAYVFYMPMESFGNSQFNLLLFYIPMITGMYVLMKTGGLIR